MDERRKIYIAKEDGKQRPLRFAKGGGGGAERHLRYLSASVALVLTALETRRRDQPDFSRGHRSSVFPPGLPFMPALYEGSSLYMPSALPGISITQASALMQEQDRIIRSFPEVETVFGTVGRSDSATDNAPLDMYDTTIMLRARRQRRAGVTYEKLIQEMDGKLQFPGLTNTWTMPVENRLDMELTGIKTAVGLKIQGPDLARIQDLGARIQKSLSAKFR